MLLLLCEGQPGRLQLKKSHALVAKNMVWACFKSGASDVRFEKEQSSAKPNQIQGTCAGIYHITIETPLTSR